MKLNTNTSILRWEAAAKPYATHLLVISCKDFCSAAKELYSVGCTRYFRLLRMCNAMARVRKGNTLTATLLRRASVQSGEFWMKR